MSHDSPTGALKQALAERGFVCIGIDVDGWLRFSGSIVSIDGAYPVVLSVHSQGSELPTVHLERIPDKLRPIAPHIGSDGYLCYAAKGSIVLDVFDLVGQTLACLDRVETVLSSILRGELVKDLEEEFFAYWHGNYCFLDLRCSSTDKVEGVIVHSGESQEKVLLVTNDRVHSLQKLGSINFHVRDKGTVAVRRIRTEVKPRPMLGSWPPRTVSDVLKWQGAMDMSSRRKLDEIITEAMKDGLPGLICLVESPTMQYAFTVKFPDRALAQSNHSVRNKREISYQSEVVPVSCVRIDDEYITRRNNPGHASLARRRVALIGCGTIGGFFAELLLKAGAGSDGGELTLIDNDILLPQNIGRHRLGFNSVLQNKAVAMAKELLRSSPSSKVQAELVDAMQTDLEKFDIVINATGEEALGHLITRRLSGSSHVPLLSVWIEGPGTAIRALLRDKVDSACVRCLCSLSRLPLYPVVEGDVPLQLAGQGCESLYVPFPASVSVQAACLGLELAIAWADGDPAPRLRTRVLDALYKKNAVDQDPPIVPGCPACST